MESGLLPTTAPIATHAASLTALLSSFIYLVISLVVLVTTVSSISAATDEAIIRRQAQAFPCRTSLESSEFARISLSSVSFVTPSPKTSQAAPITFAAASRTPSSSCRSTSLLASKADGMLSGSFAFFPPFLSTVAKASRVAAWTTATPAVSAELPALFPRDAATSSLMSGSTRVDRGINNARAPIASTRTCREGSERALTNVVWNCGTNARSAGPPFTKTRPRVRKIAIFTADGLRSPTIRNKGPVILTMRGPARYLLAVKSMSSPKPAADASRIVALP
mmetsp:Transcript_25258/g.35423  ORF Transcript_25258/g.35423 Transcript_25258/m.35423 type:complete len:280 (+) Transcript_25258:411-1250(+)